MTLNWLEMRRISNARVRQDEQSRLLTLTRENARLAEENHRLYQQYQDLAASTEIWIRLYESALQRANTGVSEHAAAGVSGTTAAPSTLVTTATPSTLVTTAAPSTLVTTATPSTLLN